MFNKYYLTLVILMLAFISCDKEPGQVTQQEDYALYLEEDPSIVVESLKANKEFWEEKFKKAPNQFPYLVKLASVESQLFSATGEIEYLIAAEKNFLAANNKTNHTKAGYLRSLARNYISQHRFGEALTLLKTAEELGEKLNSTHKMLFDVHMELGNYKKAEAYLEKIEDRSDFDFLIRYAKWSDHEGDLSTAITYMEKATEKAEISNNKELMQWSYTNLADFYGHNGEIERSYEHFLKALALDPNDAYAKKGIAWIIYSHERNPEEALRIMKTISKQHHAPDYYLLKAEIAEYMKDEESKLQNLEAYMAAVSNQNYGVMYNAHSAALYAEEFSATEEALDLAKIEVNNRPTPQAYDLLAWTYYNKGDFETALEVAEKYVADKTYEPGVLFHLAQIYKATGKLKEAQNLKKELLESAYELGPVAEQEIRQI